MGADQQIDVVIPTKGRGELIDITIQSIQGGTHQAFDLWIIDQSEDDRTERVVREKFGRDERIHYHRTTTSGSNIARNLGVSLGDAEIVAFTDDDCRVDQHWLDTILQELNGQGVGAIFGRIIDDETFASQPDDGQLDGLKLAIKDDGDRKVYRGNRFDLSFGHGANMAIRRPLLADIGGFDPLLGNGGKFKSWPERDLGYRLLSEGKSILYAPEMLIYHRHWRDWPAVKKTLINYGYGTGAAVSKYIRSGDLGGFYLLGEWILDQGVRQVLSGILKWQSWQKTQAGLVQVYYPWVGLFASLSSKVNKEKMVYINSAD